MKRLGAIVVALAMVVGAALLNNTIHDDSDDGGGAGAEASDDPVRILCATEFEAPCRALGARAEMRGVAVFSVVAPGDTVDALLADPAPTFDLWLTSKPWDEIARVRAEERRRPAPKIGEAGEVLANTPLSAAIRIARPDADGPVLRELDLLSGYCNATSGGSYPGQLSGSCLSAVDGVGFDTMFDTLAKSNPLSADIPMHRLLRGTQFKIAVPRASETGGLLAVAAMTTGWFGGPFDQTDIDVNDAFRSAFTSLAESIPRTNHPVRDLLTRGGVSLALDLNTARQLTDASSGEDYADLYFGGEQNLDDHLHGYFSAISAEAVLVPAATATGRSALRSVDQAAITEAIVFAGWARGAAHQPTLPLDVAVLDRLATQWDR